MSNAKVMSQVEVASIVCTAIGVAVTVLRLGIRKDKYGLDDIYALLSMTSLTAQLAIVLSFPVIASRFTKFYLFMATFYATIWFARLSILCTIMRISRSNRARRFLSLVIVLFVAFMALLISQTFWVCEPQRWTQKTFCKPSKQIAIFQLVSDILSDLILLIIPVRLFLLIQEKWLRYRLMLLFSTCAVTTMVSLIHAGMFLDNQGPKTMIAAIVETGVSLIVASIPILSRFWLTSGDRVEPASGNDEVPIPVLFARQSALMLSNVSGMLEVPTRPGTAQTITSSTYTATAPPTSPNPSNVSLKDPQPPV